MQTPRDAFVVPLVVSPLFLLTSGWQAAKLWKGPAKKDLWRSDTAQYIGSTLRGWAYSTVQGLEQV